MNQIKNTSFIDISLKNALDWAVLVGLDEVITETPQNRFAIDQKLKNKPASDLKVSNNKKETESLPEQTLLFDNCSTLEELEKTVLSCDIFNSLSTTATHTLFGAGSNNAKIMIIATKPGREEDLNNQLFIGSNGQLIKKIIHALNIDQDFYYTYLSKWRPPGGRDLNTIEKENLAHLLQKQIKILQPELIITFGEPALESVFNGHDFNFKKLHSKLQHIENIIYDNKFQILPLFHEEILLKTPQLKKATWQCIVNCKDDLIRQ